MNYKLLVLDVDGTLVDAQGRVNKCDVEAINQAVRKGARVALSTGRVTLACKNLLKELNLDGYHIFFDGALVINPHTDETVSAIPINKEKVLDTIKYCRESSVYLELYSHSAFYADRANWTDEIHRKFFNVSIILEDLLEVADKKEILKMETIAKDLQEYEQADALMEKFKGQLRFSVARSPAFPGVNFYNILDTGVSKGSALVTLCNHIGISPQNTIAVGDGLNDLSLLETAGLGIAMGNAFPEVKKIADAVTDSVDEGGVARVIRDYLL